MNQEVNAPQPRIKGLTLNKNEREAIIEEIAYLEELNFRIQEGLGEFICMLSDWDTSHPKDFINVIHAQLAASRIYDEVEALGTQHTKLIHDIENADHLTVDASFRDTIIGNSAANDEGSVAQLFNG